MSGGVIYVGTSLLALWTNLLPRGLFLLTARPLKCQCEPREKFVQLLQLLIKIYRDFSRIVNIVTEKSAIGYASLNFSNVSTVTVPRNILLGFFLQFPA